MKGEEEYIQSELCPPELAPQFVLFDLFASPFESELYPYKAERAFQKLSIGEVSQEDRVTKSQQILNFQKKSWLECGL